MRMAVELWCWWLRLKDFCPKTCLRQRSEVASSAVYPERIMSKLFRISPLLPIAGLGLALTLACSGGTTETPPPVPPPEATPVAAPTPTPVPVVAGEIGIPACDKYLSDFQACISKLPVEAQPGMTSAYIATRDSWKVAVASPAAKASLEATCSAMAMPAQCITALGAPVAATPVVGKVEDNKTPVPTPEPRSGTLRPPEPAKGTGDGKKGDGKKNK